MSERTSLKKEIYNDLLEDIVEGKYTQNDVINEKQLIEKYGVSKSPVRDALHELCSEGVLLCHPHYGYEIVRINEQEIWDIIGFRAILETACLRESLRRIHPSEILELEAFTKEHCIQAENSLNFLQHWENNTNFHMKLLSYCGNEYCARMVRQSIRVMTRFYAQRNWEKIGRNICLESEEHLKVIEHIKIYDVEGAVAALERDIESCYGLLYPSRRMSGEEIQRNGVRTVSPEGKNPQKAFFVKMDSKTLQSDLEPLNKK